MINGQLKIPSQFYISFPLELGVRFGGNVYFHAGYNTFDLGCTSG